MRKASCWSVLALCLIVTISARPQSEKNNQSSAGEQRMQDRINREVYHELVMLPQLTIFDNLSYKVDGNTVNLMGEVRNAVLKDEAEHAVKKIEGVEKVNNRIDILPPSPNDDRI